VKKGISWYGRFGLLITILVGTKIKFKVAENELKMQGTDTSKGYDILLARVRGDWEWERSMKTFYDKEKFPATFAVYCPLKGSTCNGLMYMIR
jgi:hypothetical protein